jgi:hypothetical protein
MIGSVKMRQEKTMDWKKTLSTVNNLKNELKSRSDIFAVQDKESAAIFFNQPIDTYYHLSVAEWKFVRDRYIELMDCISRDLDEIERWSGKDLMNTSYIELLPMYRDWLASH